MTDYYALLGVSRQAQPAIVKIAYEGKLKALAASQPDPAARAAEERELNAAYVTLANPGKKGWYDRQLEGRIAREHADGSRQVRNVALVAVALVAIVAGGWTWHSQQRGKELARLETERLTLERERLAIQAEVERAKLEAVQERQDKSLDYLKARDERNREIAAQRLQAQADARERIDLQRQQVIDMQAERERQRADEMERRRADQDLRRAQAEARRQEQWVKQREMEEERARAIRAMRSR